MWEHNTSQGAINTRQGVLPLPDPHPKVLCEPSCFEFLCEPLHSNGVQIGANGVGFMLKTQPRRLWDGGRNVKGLAAKVGGGVDVYRSRDLEVQKIWI